ncbi:Glutathione peroxidase 2 [Bagarius yarrelli]|uniref:Glutathione peroxidase n=1 Tax=Bagarius yarrelli TaxID=175774 RepID=A0A556V9V3_BAGYA|nr:Glutathione peroxidase 2 [Bagarius yarrelli]
MEFLEIFPDSFHYTYSGIGNAKMILAFIRMTELVLEANRLELDCTLPADSDDVGALKAEQEPKYNALCSCTTPRDYSQLNQLQSSYPHRLVVLAFPCNQFGYQENCRNGEILNSLKHVRPGGGFEPLCTVFEKCDVNGALTHPVFAYLKDKLPYPDDDQFSFMQDPKFLVWSPISRSDISWNFEKFLVGPDGDPFKRYSKNFETINIEPDIQRLLRLTKN